MANLVFRSGASNKTKDIRHGDVIDSKTRETVYAIKGQWKDPLIYYGTVEEVHFEADEGEYDKAIDLCRQHNENVKDES